MPKAAAAKSAMYIGPMVQIKITLQDVKAAVWRRLLVPATIWVGRSTLRVSIET